VQESNLLGSKFGENKFATTQPASSRLLSKRESIRLTISSPDELKTKAAIVRLL